MDYNQGKYYYKIESFEGIKIEWFIDMRFFKLLSSSKTNLLTMSAKIAIIFEFPKGLYLSHELE